MRTTIDWSVKELRKILPKDPDALLAFKLPAEMQERIAELLDLNSSGVLSNEDSNELEQIRKLVLRIRGLKAVALERQNREK
ncbi:MAG TPA: hypothetical protein VKX17_11430 [Planctomycetota bacterium]|nr:hypothetical protein [Planctomycetota bacterium]